MEWSTSCCSVGMIPTLGVRSLPRFDIKTLSCGSLRAHPVNSSPLSACCFLHNCNLCTKLHAKGRVVPSHTQCLICEEHDLQTNNRAASPCLSCVSCSAGSPRPIGVIAHPAYRDVPCPDSVSWLLLPSWGHVRLTDGGRRRRLRGSEEGDPGCADQKKCRRLDRDDVRCLGGRRGYGEAPPAKRPAHQLVRL